MTTQQDQQWMRQALVEAESAYRSGEVPVGAVVVVQNKVVGRGYNQTEALKDCTAHAEILALTAAFHACGSKYLPEATLYVTLEPCLMCAGAIYWSKIRRMVYGAADVKNGYRKTTGTISPFHPRTLLSAGLMEEQCRRLMQQFFRERRQHKGH